MIICEYMCASSISGGFLSSLLGVGCECEGYGLRIVGHSLGGAIAALLGMKVCNCQLMKCVLGTFLPSCLSALCIGHILPFSSPNPFPFWYPKNKRKKYTVDNCIGFVSVLFLLH